VLWFPLVSFFCLLTLVYKVPLLESCALVRPLFPHCTVPFQPHLLFRHFNPFIPLTGWGNPYPSFHFGTLSSVVLGPSLGGSFPFTRFARCLRSCHKLCTPEEGPFCVFFPSGVRCSIDGDYFFFFQDGSFRSPASGFLRTILTYIYAWFSFFPPSPFFLSAAFLSLTFFWGCLMAVPSLLLTGRIFQRSETAGARRTPPLTVGFPFLSLSSWVNPPK